jgi:hypothetical protein
VLALDQIEELLTDRGRRHEAGVNDEETLDEHTVVAPDTL